MIQTDFLKIAYLHGLAKAAGEANLSEEDIYTLHKEAVPTPGQAGSMWGKIKGILGKGTKAAPKKGVPGGRIAPASAPTAPKAPTKPPAQAGEAGAKAEENLADRLEKSRNRLDPAQVADLERAGTTGALGTMGATVAPAALGAGVGYAADGREGALMGAGIGLGARAGMSPILKRMRSAKGFQQMRGSSASKGAVPSMSEYSATPMGKKSLVGAGLGAAGGAGLGYAAGKQLPPEEPEPWFSGLGSGLTPEMMQGVGQTALPMLAQQYGLDPATIQALGSQYGLAPPSTGTEPQYDYGTQPPYGTEQY